MDRYESIYALNGRISGPVALEDADVSKPFVYCHEHGFFYVPYMSHTAVMEQLFAIDIGARNVCDAAHILKVSMDDIADLWLERTSGAAFRTGVVFSSGVQYISIWDEERLSPEEMAVFCNEKILQMKYAK